MLKTIEGIYDNGEIQLAEIPANIPSKTKVIVTFLEPSEPIIKNSPPYHDLDYLFGTWTEEDEAQFIDNTKPFRAIDQTFINIKRKIINLLDRLTGNQYILDRACQLNHLQP